MEIEQIQTEIVSLDPSKRLKAITALRQYDAQVAVPLLQRFICDKEFVVRSMAANSLGRIRNQAAFDSLVELVRVETDDNVRAEAANSLANYGDAALPELMGLFQESDHWLVRQSILAAVSETASHQDFLEFCRYALLDGDEFIQQAAISYLALFAETDLAPSALNMMLPFATSESVNLRTQVAHTLIYFDDPEAIAALEELKHDSDYRVVGATLEKSFIQ